MSAGPKVMCGKCGDIIQSTYRHDYVTCECGAISIDGGDSYTRLAGNLEQVLRPEDGKPFIKEIRDSG